MEISEAQSEMRAAYMCGGSGALVSGIIWLLSGIIAFYFNPQTVIIIFFFGGMLIHPISILIDKMFKRTGSHRKENPLGKLALESTMILFVGLFLAYSMYQFKPDLFFPIMLLIIGVRYLLFQSIYGLKIYWIFGLSLMLVGGICLSTQQSFQIPAILGGLIELIFAVLIMNSGKN